uniref:Uncharacterized protein n=1 Tax=Anguilla anguilla TaxID=7936 RepID=A0A0E9X3A9_ANGAN
MSDSHTSLRAWLSAYSMSSAKLNGSVCSAHVSKPHETNRPPQVLPFQSILFVPFLFTFFFPFLCGGFFFVFFFF